ncbi:tRNA splicing endonuclease subunit sen2 [Borealophlyctis nickersoniae]|nr:tRNA splicing endonuclease subunit sen2 [Borealophlyctis nickersoniae]
MIWRVRTLHTLAVTCSLFVGLTASPPRPGGPATGGENCTAPTATGHRRHINCRCGPSTLLNFEGAEGDPERYQLTPEEAFFLAHDQQHKKFQDGVLSPQDLWTKLSLASQPTLSIASDFNGTINVGKGTLGAQFAICYAAYHYYRSQGWVVKSGIKFGTDFVLYNKGPIFRHSDYAVVVIPSVGEKESSTLEPEDASAPSWLWVLSVNRVCAQVNKRVLFCHVVIPPDFTLNDLSSPKCLQKLAVWDVYAPLQQEKQLSKTVFLRLENPDGSDRPTIYHLQYLAFQLELGAVPPPTSRPTASDPTSQTLVTPLDSHNTYILAVEPTTNTIIGCISYTHPTSPYFSFEKTFSPSLLSTLPVYTTTPRSIQSEGRSLYVVPQYRTRASHLGVTLTWMSALYAKSKGAKVVFCKANRNSVGGAVKQGYDGTALRAKTEAGVEYELLVGDMGRVLRGGWERGVGRAVQEGRRGEKDGVVCVGALGQLVDAWEREYQETKEGQKAVEEMERGSDFSKQAREWKQKL